jgi:hypothetical protein
LSLIDTFQNLFRPRQEQRTPATTPPPPPRPSQLVQMFSAESGRRATVEDCRKMYKEDTRAQGVIDTMARDATKGGFEINVEGLRANEASDVAKAFLERIDFWTRIDDWVRLTLRDGDTFLEAGADAAGDIVKVSRKPTLEMHRWTDSSDEFYDPMRAFFWADKWWTGGDPPNEATYFAEWQIVHARYRQDEGSRYGQPLFAAARKTFKRMSEGELDIAIRRKTRAGMRYVHSLEDASDADIETYKARNKAILDDPFAAVADFFSSKKTSIAAIQGDARLSDIDDVLHHIHTWWVASPVPMSLLGYGQDLNRDILNEQKEQYDAAKEQLSGWVTEQIAAPLIERQWLLKGIWPGALTWSAQWAGKQALTAATFGEAAKALVALAATGLFTEETLLRMFALFVPEFDAEAELKAWKKKMADEVARVAANAAQTPPSNGTQPANGTQPPTTNGAVTEHVLNGHA